MSCNGLSIWQIPQWIQPSCLTHIEIHYHTKRITSLQIGDTRWLHVWLCIQDVPATPAPRKPLHICHCGSPLSSFIQYAEMEMGTPNKRDNPINFFGNSSSLLSHLQKLSGYFSFFSFCFFLLLFFFPTLLLLSIGWVDDDLFVVGSWWWNQTGPGDCMLRHASPKRLKSGKGMLQAYPFTCLINTWQLNIALWGIVNKKKSPKLIIWRWRSSWDFFLFLFYLSSPQSPLCSTELCLWSDNAVIFVNPMPFIYLFY